jgi:hypothetical protein
MSQPEYPNFCAYYILAEDTMKGSTRNSGVTLQRNRIRAGSRLISFYEKNIEGKVYKTSF